MALVSVGAELVVWSDGFRLLWWGGGTSEVTGYRRYVVRSVSNPAATARRIALRYAELQDDQPLPELVAEMS